MDESNLRMFFWLMVGFLKIVACLFLSCLGLSLVGFRLFVMFVFFCKLIPVPSLRSCDCDKHFSFLTGLGFLSLEVLF